MVYAVDLVLGEDGVDGAVELPGGVEVHAEGFFHNDATPATVFYLVSAPSQGLHGGREQEGSECQVVQAVGGAVGGLDLCEGALQGLEAVVGGYVAVA